MLCWHRFAPALVRAASTVRWARWCPSCAPKVIGVHLVRLWTCQLVTCSLGLIFRTTPWQAPQTPCRAFRASTIHRLVGRPSTIVWPALRGRTAPWRQRLRLRAREATIARAWAQATPALVKSVLQAPRPRKRRPLALSSACACPVSMTTPLLVPSTASLASSAQTALMM